MTESSIGKLPSSKKHIPHWDAGVIFCCRSPKASEEDSKDVEKTGIVRTVNCVNCRGVFRLSFVKINENLSGLHVGRIDFD